MKCNFRFGYGTKLSKYNNKNNELILRPLFHTNKDKSEEEK